MTNPYQRLGLVQELISAEKFDAARQRLDQLAAELPDEPHVYVLRSVMGLRQNQYAQGEKFARIALELDAESTVARSLLASSLNAQRRYKEALLIIEEAIALDPTAATEYAIKAQALVQLDRFTEAEQTARAGLSFDPDHEDCRNVLALALNLQGRRDQASVAVNDLLELNPVNPYAHVNAGYVALHQGRIAQAKEHFVEALRIEPRNANAQAGLAETIKATNPFYRWLLAWGVWMHDIGSKYRWGLIIGLLLVVNLVPVLVPVYLALLLWNWLTAPISTAYLLLHKVGRYLVPADDRPYAVGILVCLVAAIGFGVFGLVTGNALWYLVAAACALSTIMLQQIITQERHRRALLVNGLTLGATAVLALIYATAAISGTRPIVDINGLIIVAVAYSWIGPRIGGRS